MLSLTFQLCLRFKQKLQNRSRQEVNISELYRHEWVTWQHKCTTYVWKNCVQRTGLKCQWLHFPGSRWAGHVNCWRTELTTSSASCSHPSAECNSSSIMNFSNSIIATLLCRSNFSAVQSVLASSAYFKSIELECGWVMHWKCNLIRNLYWSYRQRTLLMLIDRVSGPHQHQLNGWLAEWKNKTRKR